MYGLSSKHTRTYTHTYIHSKHKSIIKQTHSTIAWPFNLLHTSTTRTQIQTHACTHTKHHIKITKNFTSCIALLIQLLKHVYTTILVMFTLIVKKTEKCYKKVRKEKLSLPSPISLTSSVQRGFPPSCVEIRCWSVSVPEQPLLSLSLSLLLLPSLSLYYSFLRAPFLP